MEIPWPQPDKEGIKTRRIKDALPYVNGIMTGQAKKSLRLPDSYFPTLTTGIEGIELMTNSEIRYLNEEELKIVSGLDESFSFEGVSLRQAYKICGNAVPAPLMYALVKAIKDAYVAKFGEID